MYGLGGIGKIVSRDSQLDEDSRLQQAAQQASPDYELVRVGAARKSKAAPHDTPEESAEYCQSQAHMQDIVFLSRRSYHLQNLE